MANTHESTVLRRVIQENCGVATMDGRLSDVEDPNVCRASSGGSSIVCKAAQRDGDAWLDRLRSVHADWRLLFATRARVASGHRRVRLSPSPI